MGLMIPALAGYIAYSIGDRPALVPGFIGGFLANNGFDGLKNTIDGNDTNFTSGFLGAILAGLVAGYLIQILRLCTKRIPEKFSATKPMLIYPLVGTIVTGLLVI
jgi:PTS system fructose-specific IIC component